MSTLTTRSITAHFSHRYLFLKHNIDYGPSFTANSETTFQGCLTGKVWGLH